MTSLLLTYIPIIESMHVYLNGIEMQIGTDWEYDEPGNRVITLTPMDERSDDKLECRYAHRGTVLTYDRPIVIGTPWGYLESFSGTRVVYFRLEGRDRVPVGYDTNIIVGFEESFSGPGSTDVVPGGYAVVCTDQGYADNIYRMGITRPYTEPGEAPFTKIHVFVGEWYSSLYIAADNSPATIFYDGDAGSPPPTSYQG